MRRLTTPEHKFTLQVDPSVIKKVRVIYSQDNQPVLIKEGNQIQLEGAVAKIKLTQEETKKFVAGKKAEIQVRFLDFENNSFGSEIIEVDVKRMLDDEVMV